MQTKLGTSLQLSSLFETVKISNFKDLVGGTILHVFASHKEYWQEILEGEHIFFWGEGVYENGK